LYQLEKAHRDFLERRRRFGGNKALLKPDATPCKHVHAKATFSSVVPVTLVAGAMIVTLVKMKKRSNSAETELG